MTQRHVIILSSRGLYREGLKRLLADAASVALATSFEKGGGRMRQISPDFSSPDRAGSDLDFSVWQRYIH